MKFFLQDIRFETKKIRQNRGHPTPYEFIAGIFSYFFCFYALTCSKKINEKYIYFFNYFYFKNVIFLGVK